MCGDGIGAGLGGGEQGGDLGLLVLTDVHGRVHLPPVGRRHHVRQVLVGIAQIPLCELVEVAVGVSGESVVLFHHPEEDIVKI